MSVKLTLKQALSIWEQEIEKIPPETVFHANENWIKKFAKGDDIPDKSKWINHMTNCHICRKQFFAQNKKNEVLSQFTDIFLPKAASSTKNFFDSVTKIDSLSGKYCLTFRKNLEDSDSCLITLNVLNDTHELENQRISVRDKKHTVLLSGPIYQGELSGWFKGIDEIDFTSITIIPEISKEV